MTGPDQEGVRRYSKPSPASPQSRPIGRDNFPVLGSAGASDSPATFLDSGNGPLSHAIGACLGRAGPDCRSAPAQGSPALIVQGLFALNQKGLFEVGYILLTPNGPIPHRPGAATAGEERPRSPRHTGPRLGNRSGQFVKFSTVSNIEHLPDSERLTERGNTMLDQQNQGPQCTACGSLMRLSAIEQSATGQNLRTFSCPECKRVQRHIIESTVTEAWLGPRRSIKVRHENAVTHEIHDGRLISKPAK